MFVVVVVVAAAAVEVMLLYKEVIRFFLRLFWNKIKERDSA